MWIIITHSLLYIYFWTCAVLAARPPRWHGTNTPERHIWRDGNMKIRRIRWEKTGLRTWFTMSILPPVERRRDGEEEEEETGGGSRGGRREWRERKWEGEEAALRHLFFILSCVFRRFSRLQGGWRTVCLIFLRILPLILTGLFKYLLGYLFISHHLKKKDEILTGGVVHTSAMFVTPVAWQLIIMDHKGAAGDDVWWWR